MSYERLMREHAQIEIAAQRLLALVGSADPDLDGTVIALADLSRELGAHLAHEDSFIYPRMIRGDNERMRESANAFAAEFASLRADWSVYLSEWSAQCIAADWAHFCEVTIAILDRLARRVDAENNILYMMALRDSVLPLRDTAA